MRGGSALVGLALAWISAIATDALAGGRVTVAGFAMPSRRGQAAWVGERARQVAHALARNLAGQEISLPARPADDLDVVATLARARRFEASAAVDQAAMAYDRALEADARAPHAIANPDSYVSASVARASLALARGEVARADELLGRLVRADLGFQLRPDEDRPTLRAALERVRGQLAARAALRELDLGASCRAADVLVVARALEGDAAELIRFDACRQVAAAVVRPTDSIDEAARPLAAVDRAGARRGGADLTEVGTRPAGHRDSRRPLVRRPWFWVAIGAVVVGAAAGGALFALDRKEQVDVVPSW